MELKAQDTLLAIKYWSLNQDGQVSRVRHLAEAIGISASEVSKGTKRLMASHLAVERSGKLYVESGALLEWLCYGVRYAYPQESIGYGRGMATAWNCPLLKCDIVPPLPAWVWPVAAGNVEGILISPIHNAVPLAASRDENLYRVMSLLEAIRGGKPRELSIARDQLTKLIKGTK